MKLSRRSGYREETYRDGGDATRDAGLSNEMRLKKKKKKKKVKREGGQTRNINRAGGRISELQTAASCLPAQGTTCRVPRCSLFFSHYIYSFELEIKHNS